MDLKEYFNHSEKLEKRLDQYDMILVGNGNTFVLAQAFKLSGFNKIITKYFNKNQDIAYGGYSVGICNIGTTLEGVHLADDPYLNPYPETDQTIWEGSNILDYALVPHYKSGHERISLYVGAGHLHLLSQFLKESMEVEALNFNDIVL